MEYKMNTNFSEYQVLLKKLIKIIKKMDKFKIKIGPMTKITQESQPSEKLENAKPQPEYEETTTHYTEGPGGKPVIVSIKVIKKFNKTINIDVDKLNINPTHDSAENKSAAIDYLIRAINNLKNRNDEK